MKMETIVYCVIALLLGMLLANMLKNVCGCGDVVEGQCDCNDPTSCSGHRRVQYPSGYRLIPTCDDGTDCICSNGGRCYANAFNPTPKCINN